MKTDQWLNQLCELAFDPFGIHENGVLIKANKLYFDMFGYKPEELIGIDVVPVTIAPESLEFKKTQIVSDTPASYEIVALKKDGTNFPVEISSRFAEHAGRKVKIVTMRDITERKKAEDELKESEEKYRILFDSSQYALMTLAPPSWNFTSGNPKTIEMFNVKDEKQFISLGPWQLSPEKQPDGQLSSVKAEEMIEKAMKHKSNFFEWTHKKYNGKDFPCTVLLNKVVTEKMTFLQATVMDITERKKAQEKLIQIMKAVDSTSDAVGISGPKGHHIYQNKALSDLFEYATPEELEAAGGGAAVVKDPTIGKEIFENITRGNSWVGELEMVTKSGRVFPAFERADAIKDDEGNIIGLIGIITDITAHKKVEESLKKSLAEKEVLLKEVHHRVKNNLQLIVSLMRTQTRTIVDENALVLFRECVDRVVSIAQLYNLLNIAKNNASVNIAQYASDIVERIVSTHLLKGISVTPAFRLKDIELPLDFAVPCGLIINEIVMNSLKHGFPGRQKGDVGVDLAEEDGRITLTVYDNGVGIPEHIEFQEAESIGFGIIRLLAKQINAEVTLSRKNGTHYTFKLNISS